MINQSTPISSITQGPRQTNMELLRIVAMFLILLVHADFWSLGYPTTVQYKSDPVATMTRIIFEVIAIISIDIFVLISGWFSIKPSVKGFCNFIFQCAYFLIGIYALLVVLGIKSVSLDGLLDMFMLTKNHWFIKAYIGLYILAPALNIFCEKASKKQFKTILICFFTFQTLYGFSGATDFIQNGYSTFSFIGLYLLARYLNIYKPTYYKLGGAFILLYFITNILFSYVLIISGHDYLLSKPFDYTNPLVILGATGMLLLFSSIKMPHNAIINWLAASSFAAYLFHGVVIYDYFKPLMLHLYSEYNGVFCLAAMGSTLLAFYIIDYCGPVRPTSQMALEDYRKKILLRKTVTLNP